MEAVPLTAGDHIFLGIMLALTFASFWLYYDAAKHLIEQKGDTWQKAAGKGLGLILSFSMLILALPNLIWASIAIACIIIWMIIIIK